MSENRMGYMLQHAAVMSENKEIINNGGINNNKTIADNNKIDMIKADNIQKRNVNIFGRRDVKKEKKQQ